MADERGGVLIIVALMLPVLLLLASFVIDSANWWVHKRHLQTQADAGAFAAAQNYRFPTCDGAIDTSIAATAQQYAGISTPSTPAFNSQIGQGQQAALGDDDVPGAVAPPPPSALPARGVHMLLNSPSFYDRPGTIVDAELTGNPGPCAAKFVDVKMTETGVPWFFRAAGVDYIDAQARVGIHTAESLSGLLPVGVENVNPSAVHVWLVDEDTGIVLAQADLAKDPGAGGSLPYWDNEATRGSGPMTVNVQSERIGVRVAMSGSDTANLTGSYATVCAQALVVCEPDAAAAARGLARVRGYATAPGGTAAPEAAYLREVLLTPPAGCAAPATGYFSTSCTSATLRARIDGIADTATVRATIENTNQAVTLTKTAGYWTASMPIATLGTGAYHVDIDWVQTSGKVGTTDCRTGGQNTCKATYLNVQSTFSAARASAGPIRALTVSATPLFGAPAGADSYNVPSCTAATGCEQAFVVRVGVGGNLALGSPSDPPVSLRVFGGSRTQSLRCDPTKQHLDEEIAFGCTPEYAVNHGTACPTQTTLWASPQPWTCVAVRTGTQPNEPASGLNQRVYGAAKPGNVCPPSGSNHWPTYPLGDKREMPVFMVPFGSFDGSGANTTVPIIGFAAFYVTGWTANGQGFQNPCQNQGDQFVPGTEDDNGAVSGHFLKAAFPGGGSNGEACDFAEIDACVAVLVK